MKGNKRKLLSLGVISLSVVLTVAGFFLLPERATVNISFSGQTEYKSKIAILTVPFVLTCITSSIYFMYGKLFNKEVVKDDFKTGIKFIVFSAVGILLTLWAIINNVK